jgi:molybdopterin adenylyltransferase
LNTESTIAKIAILTVSDRASSGGYSDRGGPAIKAYLEKALSCPWEAFTNIVADDVDTIEKMLIHLADEIHCSLIVTTGGTGPAPRDVTPEATRAVCEKELPGFGERMRSESLRYVPTAILSRQTAGIRGRCLIVNLPGQPRAIGQCLDAVFPAIPYCIDLIGGPYLTTHDTVIKAFRPTKEA